MNETNFPERTDSAALANASERAVDEVIRLLIGHAYHPGDRLFETELAERLNMSRTPIRTALTRLATCGFLEKGSRQRGYLIPVLMPKDMCLVFETRELLEGALAAQAALNRRDDEVAALKAICEKEKVAFDELDKQRYAEANNKFHFSIAKFARNPYLERCLIQVFWRSHLYDFFFSGFYNRPLTQEQRQKRRSWNEHVSIVEAIESRDAVSAEERMKWHLRHTKDHILNEPILSKDQKDT